MQDYAKARPATFPEADSIDDGAPSLSGRNGLNRALSEYNDLLQFVPYDADHCQPAREHHTDILRARDELANSIQQIKARISALKDELHDALRCNVQYSATNDKYWYRRANIMTLEASEINGMFGENPPEDAVDFTEILCEVVLPSLSPADQPHRCFWARNEKKELRREDGFARVLALREALLKSPDPEAGRQALFFTVFVLAKCLPRKPAPITWYSPKPLYRYVAELLQRHSLGHCPEQGTKPREWPYWNAAAARRILWSAHQSHDCNKGFGSYDEHHYNYWLSDDSDNCFHKRNIALLENLQRQAYWEIEENVVLAVGERLLAELAALVCEWAWRVEEVDPVPDYRVVDVRQKPLDGTMRRNIKSSGRLLPGFCCENIKDLPHDDSLWSVGQGQDEPRGLDRQHDEASD